MGSKERFLNHFLGEIFVSGEAEDHRPNPRREHPVPGVEVGPALRPLDHLGGVRLSDGKPA